MSRLLRKPLRAAAASAPRSAALGLLLAGALLAVSTPGGEVLAQPRDAALGDGYVIYENAEPVPATPFRHKVEGLVREVDLRDFAGRVVVLNFWATWCAPCVAEMPSLDRLQAALGDEGIAVVALSEDRGGFTQIDAFFEDHGLAALERYHDPNGAVAQAFGLAALPTTVLIGPDGVPVGEVSGAAEWDSPEAQKLLRALLD